MARDRLLPCWIASVNRGGTPTTALILFALATVVLVLSGGYERLAALASFLFVAIYLSGPCALLALRVLEPGLPRPFKAWGYPWTIVFALSASLAFLVGTTVGYPKDAVVTLTLIALTYPVYFFAVKTRRKGID
jgi:APA family basic amino acid/polyamine antiporter